MELSNREKALVGIALAAAVLAAAAVIYYKVMIPSSGIIASVELKIFKDEALSEELKQIYWGWVYPNSTQYIDMWIKNVGSMNLKLDINAINWNPSEASQLAFYHDYRDVTMIPDQMIKVRVALHCPANISGVTSFSFDISIQSQSVP